MDMRPVDTLRRLSEIRRTIRRRLGLYGVCAVLSGGCLSFCVVIAVDWVLELPALMRVFVAALFVLGFGLATLHWIVRPMQTRLTLAQVAGRLERHFGGLDDRLSSTVSFLTGGGMRREGDARTSRGGREVRRATESVRGFSAGRERDRSEGRGGAAEVAGDVGRVAEVNRARWGDVSAALMAQVIINTDRVVATMPLEGVLTRRPLVRQASLLAVGVAMVAVMSVAAGDWIGIGVRRYLRPFGDTRWPHRVEIVAETGDFMVPIGESATVRMRAVRGLDAALRGVVRLVDSQGRKTVLAMHREGMDGYRCTIDGVSGDLSYWFEAGDDSTRHAPSRIRAVRRVGVVSALARIEPPDYASRAGAAEYDLSVGPASAVPGSWARIALRTTKAIGRRDDGGAAAWLERVDAEGDVGRAALLFADGDARRLVGRFAVDASLKLVVHMVDRDGFANQSGESYRIVTHPDEGPRVELVEPRSSAEVTPGGSVMIRAVAEDDFGLTALRLVGQIGDRDASFSTSLLEQAVVSSSATAVTATAEYLWEIEPLKLKPPVTVLYRVEARDNCTRFETEGVVGQVGASRVMRLRVIGEAELAGRIREEFALLQKRLRRALLAQEATTDEVEALAEATGTREGGAKRAVDRAMGLAGREDGVARDVLELSGRFERLGRRVALNGVHGAASIDVLRAAGDGLSSVARGAMAEVTHLLERAFEAGSESEGGGGGGLALAEAATQGHAAADRLRALIRQMDQWGDFQDVVSKARDMVDRQERLRRQTRTLGGRTLGKRAEELTPAQRRDLRQLERRQRQLADELGGLLARLGEAAASRAGEDPAGAATMRAALRAASAGEVVERMGRAAAAVAENRLAGAGVEQRLAERGLSQMLAGLEEREVRRLAELVKRLDRADVAAGALLADQEALLAATREAVAAGSAAGVFGGLSSDQARLERNATGLGEALSGSDETSDAGRLIRQSGRMMRRAVDSLSGGDGSGALEPQASAVGKLRAATALLEARARLAAHRASQRMMAAVRARLEEVRVRQVTIREATQEALTVIEGRGRLNRSAVRKVAKAAKEQEEVKEAMREVGKQVGETVVYARVVGWIVDDMVVSLTALHGRRVTTALTERQGEIVRRLDQLVRALREAAALPPSDEFVESDGGGGGSGAGRGKKHAAIPTAAELLMLKTMQVALLTDTMNLGVANAGGEPPTEVELRGAEALGVRQREVRELTEAVVRKAKGGS